MSLEIDENYYSSILGEKSIIIWGNGGTARRIVEELPMLNIKGFLCLDSEESEIQIAEKNFKVLCNFL